MTGAEFMAVGMFGLAVIGAIFGAFWKMWALIKDAAAEGIKAQSDLAAHKLHAAEHFATKAGMQEQTHQIMRAIESVGGRLDAISERIDRILENQPRRTTRGG